eukprot:1730263-Rhodomonas_salina.1
MHEAVSTTRRRRRRRKRVNKKKKKKKKTRQPLEPDTLNPQAQGGSFRKRILMSRSWSLNPALAPWTLDPRAEDVGFGACGFVV